MSMGFTHGSKGRKAVRSGEIRGAEGARKTVYLTVLVQNAAKLTTETLAVPGVQVITKVPKGSSRFAGPFYFDQIELLRETVSGLRNRERYAVVPMGIGFNILKLPRK